MNNNQRSAEDLLLSWLSQVRAGKITSVAVAGILGDREGGTVEVSEGAPLLMIAGSVNHLLSRINNALNDITAPVE